MFGIFSEPQEISGLDGGVIGGVVGGVIIILVIILGMLFFMRKNGNNIQPLVRTYRDKLDLNRMTSVDLILSILHLGSNIISNWHTYRSLSTIHQYMHVSIIRSLNTWTSQDTK